MILNVAFNEEHLPIIENLKLLLENYPLITLHELDEGSFLTKKEANKLKYFYGARLSPFANLTDNDGNHVEAFYTENRSFNLDYIKAVLDHWILYNPIIEDGHDRTEETEGGS